MAVTIDAVERELSTPDGGLLRYAGDDYIGGNPWILARLWLGLARRDAGAEVAADGIDHAVAKRPVRACSRNRWMAVTGEPRWVVPLTWSHAMYVLACSGDVLERRGDTPQDTSPAEPQTARAGG